MSDDVVGVFLRHVGLGRIDEARAMLDSEPKLVNTAGPHPFWGGRPQALHVAIESGRRDLFELLLERGADVSGSNEQYDHWSPLMLAIHRNHSDLRDELLRRGARVGLTEALMLADDARVEELLANGLPDITPNDGSILAFARTTRAIDLLMDLGVRADVKDRWGSTPIEAMSRLGSRGHELVRHMIARGVQASPADYARLGDKDALARNPADARLDAVMMGAVDCGHHELVAWLLERGANVNARADAQSRQTALHAAAWNGDLRMVKLLVDAGADQNARDEQHDATPLGWAETSHEITNNMKCADVVAYFANSSRTRLSHDAD